MNIHPRIVKTGAILLSGAAIGGTVGYAASASGASTSHTRGAHAAKAAHAGGGGATAKRLRRAVSITAVVPAAHGSFTTVSVERGTLASVSGQTLSLREGTRRSTYKTVAVTLSAKTVVRLAGKPSSLSALTAGDRLTVVQGPRRSTVLAHPPRTGASATSSSAAAPGAASPS